MTSWACNTVIVITTKVTENTIKFAIVDRINNCIIRFLTGAMASSTLSFMEFTFSTVAPFNKVTFSAADSFPSTTFSITEPQMFIACTMLGC